MGSHLPVISGRDAARAFERAGWTWLTGRGKGHLILAKEGTAVILSVPDHRELKRGTLRSLIRDAGLSVEEFVDLLR